jgi:hypothetical protein
MLGFRWYGQLIQVIGQLDKRRMVHHRKSGNEKAQARQIGYASETGLGSYITSNSKV